MNEVRLTLKEQIKNIPIEADVIRPDTFADKSLQEIEALPLFQGNKQLRLSELFEVRGEKANHIRIMGDLSHIKKIGCGMSGGKIIIEGNVGMHLGATMKGGEIAVIGNVGDWLGAEMNGGIITVKGKAGNFIGAAYHGSKRGMKNGIIIIDGDADNEIGERMRSGLIVILKNAGNFLGANMIAGSIIVFGRVGTGLGVGMKRGTIICLQEEKNADIKLFSTFPCNCTYNPTFLRVCLRALRPYGIEIKEEYINGRYRRYNGDIAELGKGEILIYERN